MCFCTDASSHTTHDAWNSDWFCSDDDDISDVVSGQSSQLSSSSHDKATDHDSGKVGTASASTIGVSDWECVSKMSNDDHSPSSTRTVSPDNIPAEVAWMLDENESGYDGDNEM